MRFRLIFFNCLYGIVFLFVIAIVFLLLIMILLINHAVIYLSESLSHSDLMLSFINPEYTVIIIKFLYIITMALMAYYWMNGRILIFNNWIKNKVEDLFKKKEEKEKEKEKENWGKIISLIETTHHTSIISKIKDLESEDKINFPNFNFKYNFNRKFLHKIREFIMLFEVILEKMKHRSFYEENKDEKEILEYKQMIEQKLQLIYTLKYKYKLYLQFYHFVYMTIPFFVMLFISGILYVLGEDTSHSSYLLFFGGVALLSLLFSFLGMVDSFINLKVIKLRNKPDIVLKSFYILFASFFLTLLTLIGLSLIESTSDSFSHLFGFFQSIVFHTEIKGLSFILVKTLSLDMIVGYLLVIKLIILVTIALIIYYVINYSIKEYDQFYYEQKIKKYLLPPDLLKIISMVMLSLFSIAYLYINVSSPLKLASELNTTKECLDITYCKLKYLEKENTALKEAKSMENLLPFSIFLALLGTLLALSTRDIMENYFTGLSLKVNAPYEEGDRVKIGNYGILEVREIGTRSDEFYEIETNSIISIPHKRLAQMDVKNYTRPTLDYREEISIYIPDNILKEGNIPRKSEKLLLLSAFINTGVKIPQIDGSLSKKIKPILDEYIIELNSETTSEKLIKAWDKIKELNTKENQFLQKLFIGTLPFNLIDNQKGDTIYLIKKSILAIIFSIIEFQEKLGKLNIYADKNGIRRKYEIFKNIKDKDLDEFATVLVDISFYYYMLSNRLWELKEAQNSLIQRRKIDKAMTEILAVPKITSEHYLDNATLYWKSTLLVSLELTEEGKETIHHINMYIDELWDRLLVFKEDNR